ncbi:MAG: hypothetical protein V3V99_03155 [candidate division Zixibacteria bacterium]
MTFDTKIRAKAEGLKKLLQQEYPELLNKKASIKNGSPESGYWYLGYYVALCDVLRLMDEELENATSGCNSVLDRDSLFRPACPGD